MLRHVPKPLYARGLEPDVGVEAAGDCTLDDRLLLLLQQFDQFLLGPDVASDPSVYVVEEPDDPTLLGQRRKKGFKAIEIVRVETEAAFNNASGNSLDSSLVPRRAKQM